MTTDRELAVLEMICSAWKAYLELPIQHPDDLKEFHLSVHRMQDLIAVRVARRADPKTWACVNSAGESIQIDPA